MGWKHPFEKRIDYKTSEAFRLRKFCKYRQELSGKYKRLKAMENFTDVKLEIFVPQEYAPQIRDVLAGIGVGRIGNYDHCVAISQVQGYFRPLEGANPFEGEVGKISEGIEYKIEVNCRRELVNDAVRAIKRVHPYEEPLINIFPLVNHLFDKGDKK